MLVVLDTNVIIYAILFGGKPRQVLEGALFGSIQISISEPLIAELRGVLQRPKFGFETEMVQSIVTEMTSIAKWASPRKHFELISNDGSDNQVIDCAVEAKADYIITGDRHLLQLGNYERIQIVNPDAFIEILKGEEKGFSKHSQ